jgi:hypothetical protein
LDVLDNGIIVFLSFFLFKIRVCDLLVHIYNFVVDFRNLCRRFWFFRTLLVLFDAFKIILWDVHKIFNISLRSCIFPSFSQTKSVLVIFCSNSIFTASLSINLLFLNLNRKRDDYWKD